MSRFQEGSLLRLKRKTGPDSWVFRWYDESSGERKYRKIVVGTVDRLPTRHDAEGAVLSLRRNINAEHKSPETVTELIAHYRQLRADSRAQSFRDHRSNEDLPKAAYRPHVGREAAFGGSDGGGRKVASFTAVFARNPYQDSEHHVRIVQSRDAS